jgi:dTDP-4-amino-4,6-dideoxygalactose transaminase
MTIPFNDLRPLLRSTESEWRRALKDLMRRGAFILGEDVAAFEREFASETGAGHAVGVANGTAALELCLRAAGLYGSGADVLTSPLTAPFTGLAIRAAGCRPRFADIDPATLLLSPEDAARRITGRTAAILPVHLYGQVCDLDAFGRLARKAGAALIQDACQAHGARFRGKPLTHFSPYVAYSFYPTKNLGCLGDGGAVTTDRSAVASKVRLLRDGARGPNHVSRDCGVNSRLDELHAAFLRVFLKRLGSRNEQRSKLAEVYKHALADCPGVEIVPQAEGSVHHLFVIRAQKRQDLREFLTSRGIATGIHYPVPLHLQPAFRDCGLRRRDLPEAERACREILSLPLWPEMPKSAALRVAASVRAFYDSPRTISATSSVYGIPLGTDVSYK